MSQWNTIFRSVLPILQLEMNTLYPKTKYPPQLYPYVNIFIENGFKLVDEIEEIK